MKGSERFRSVTLLLKRYLALGIAFGVCLVLGAGSAAADPLSSSHVTVSRRAVSLPGPTFAWAESPKIKDVENHPSLQDPQFRARLQSALDKALKGKGYRPAADRTKADFVIAYRVGIRESQEVTMEGDQGATPLAMVACDGNHCSQLVVLNDSTPTMKVVTTDRIEGGLMIEVLEPQTIRVLWRALNRGDVKRGDGKQSTLDAIAANTLRELPPIGR